MPSGTSPLILLVHLEMCQENRLEIIYSPKHVEDMRRVDPQFVVMTQQWEQMFRGRVQVTLQADRSLVVKPRNENQRLP